MKLFLLALSFLCLGSCAIAHSITSVPQIIDPTPAIKSGDYTALIEGCGEQLSVGFIVCRKIEGDTAGDSLTFVAPPVKCKGSELCVTFKIFFTDTTPSLGGAILQGQTRTEVPWSKILKRNTFELGDRGFWGYSYSIRYVDEAGIERIAYSQGEIYLRVLKRSYIPLHAVQEDPYFVWKWKENGIQLKSTTGMRIFVEKK